MVAVVRVISSAGNAGKYFYWTEKDCECARSWQNTKGCQILQLGELHREDLEDALEGRIKEGENRIQLGRREGKELKHHPGQEIILSAPKSVSIMALVVGDKRIQDAHEKAVKDVVDYIERNMVYTRVQEKGNMMFEKTDNMVAAKFTHLTARPTKTMEFGSESMPDPQLHTHCIVGNMTKCEDGTWRSIVFDKFYDNKMHIGELYRMKLAHGLRELGYELELEKDKSNHWTFEIKGVSKGNIEEFSRRRSDILEAAKEAGRDDAEGLAYIAKTTRGEKTECHQDILWQNWESRAISLDAMKEIVNRGALPKIAIDVTKEISHAINVLSDKEAVFTKEKLIAEIIARTKDNCTIQTIEEGVDKYIGSGNLKESCSQANMLTTPGNLRAEQSVINVMHGMQNITRPLVGKAEIYRALQNTELTVGQKEAVVLVLNTMDQVVGIQGSAGTGKTTVLQYVSQFAAAKNYEIIGLAPTKAAAVNMEHAGKIEAFTLDRFLLQYQGVIAGRGTQDGMRKMQNEFSNKIVVLDEASMVSTEKMSNLLQLSDKLGFRTVLVGDMKQLGSIEAGKLFYYMQEHGLNTVTMDNTKRQKNEVLKDAVNLSSTSIDRQDFARHANKIFGKLGKNGIVEIGSGATNMTFADAIYDGWKNHHNEGKNVLIVVPSNSMRREVNAQIRPHFVDGPNFAHGVLHGKLLTNTQLKGYK